jgi:DNA-binding CsgD family transcriptional regulator
VPQIAEALHISQNTVRNHLKSIFQKIGVSSQAALIRKVRSLSS